MGDGEGACVVGHCWFEVPFYYKFPVLFYRSVIKK